MGLGIETPVIGNLFINDIFIQPIDRINCKWDAATMKEASHMELLFAHLIDTWIEYDSDESAFRRLQGIQSII